MAVDYGNPRPTGGGKSEPVKPTVKEVLAAVPDVPSTGGGGALGFASPVVEKPTEIEVFLSLLTAHTMFSGGVKYWANARNTPSSIKLLKQRAKEIVEAY